MRIDVQPLVMERDRLESRRDRLRELLADGSVSEQMRVWLRQSLAEVDSRLMILSSARTGDWAHNLAA